jgi:hypothetical protein
MDKPTKIPTDRSFGLTFAVVFALLGGWLLWNSSRFAVSAFGVAAVFALFAVWIERSPPGPDRSTLRRQF